MKPVFKVMLMAVAYLATLRISKALLNNALTLSTFAYADVRDGGMFLLYKDNSEIWVKLKYSF